MNDPKNFLMRWSRRKRESAEERDTPPLDEKTALPSTDRGVNDPDALVKPAPAPEFDIKTLPPIESIGVNSDIRAFLRPGVPAGLTRAALRRAWSADPAIRDFIGLSENSWDFTAPDSLPGFGPLDAEEIRRLAAQLFGEANDAAAPADSSSDRHSLAQPPSAARESEMARAHEMRNATSPESASAKPAQGEDVENSGKKTDVMGSPEQAETGVAAQYREENSEYDTASLRRRHGRALPE